MVQYTRRIIGFDVHAGNADGPALCRMFNEAISGQDWPRLRIRQGQDGSLQKNPQHS
jgi:hypothetical protein